MGNAIGDLAAALARPHEQVRSLREVGDDIDVATERQERARATGNEQAVRRFGLQLDVLEQEMHLIQVAHNQMRQQFAAARPPVLAPPANDNDETGTNQDDAEA